MSLTAVDSSVYDLLKILIREQTASASGQEILEV